MKTRTMLVACGILFTLHYAAFAHNKVVVVPLGDGTAEFKTIKNIVTVGLDNADFSNPMDAMAAITDASSLNPYLIVIGPGTYTMGQPLQIKPNVHLAGSGVDVTILEAGYGATNLPASAVVTTSGGGSSRVSIRDLSIIQYGFGQYSSTGIYANGPTVIDNVDIDVRASGPNNYGIYANQSPLTLRKTTINVRNATSFSIGTYLNAGSAGITDTTINVRNGTFVAAVYNESSLASLERTSAAASKLSGTNAAWGLYSRNNASTSGRYSTINILNGVNSGGGGCSVLDTSNLFFSYSHIGDGCVGAGDRSCVYSVSSEAHLAADCSL
ncbi:hypothetical protein GCM10008090_34870 [Arenicella chitinivorans]|uniref:Pectate lyase superfamily protein domain-containing protein n=1 Tax=Arenicella chitinivorans TaxID=1329800 RepID=A0A918S3I2_9GAMM|nr:hypothetical protein [Arenicella chitinivorans]GHA22070.1 hypothetical protein GCM10008090_34870 [Arenicella chitinivorans]